VESTRSSGVILYPAHPAPGTGQTKGVKQMSDELEELTREQRRFLQLIFDSVREPNAVRSAALTRQAGEELVMGVRKLWKNQLDAAEALLNRAEEVLDQAEASKDPKESARLMQLFDIYLEAARADGC
jgi:hypothetical protein